MIKVLFICHGNICRSPMAEFILKNMADKQGVSDDFLIASAATSTEEIGNPIHRGTREILKLRGVPVGEKRACQMTEKDYSYYDYIIGMDSWNLRNILRITGGDPEGKVSRLLDFTDHPGDIADPWYTGDFETTYAEISAGCEAFLRKIWETR